MQTVVKTDSTSARQVAHEVDVKGSSVTSPDVLLLLEQMRREQKAQTILLPGQPAQTVYRTIKDDNGVMLRFMLDAQGKFQADCSKKDSMIRYMATELEHWHKIATTQTVVKEKPNALTTVFSGLPWYWKVSCALGIVLLIAIGGLRLIRP